MLRVLIAAAIALPLYELLRYRILRRLRESQRRKARSYAEEHGVRVDLFKFGGKQLVREELLNDRAILRAMEAATDAGERPTEVRQRVEEYIDEDRKSTRLNSSHRCISYAVFCLKKKK